MYDNQCFTQITRKSVIEVRGFQFLVEEGKMNNRLTQQLTTQQLNIDYRLNILNDFSSLEVITFKRQLPDEIPVFEKSIVA